MKRTIPPSRDTKSGHRVQWWVRWAAPTSAPINMRHQDQPLGASWRSFDEVRWHSRVYAGQSVVQPAPKNAPSKCAMVFHSAPSPCAKAPYKGGLCMGALGCGGGSRTMTTAPRWIKASGLLGQTVRTDVLYPCLCGFSRRSCESDWCDCWGRADAGLMPADCCARRWTAELAGRKRREAAARRGGWR